MELEEEIRLVHAVVLTPEQEASIDEAMRNARDPDDEDVAVAAGFDVPTRMLYVELKMGQRIAVPQEELQELYRAAPADLAEVEILGPGTSLHFERAMEGVHVGALRRGTYGNERWMAGLAQRRRERLAKAS